jgi:DNA recombination protein RmuC
MDPILALIIGLVVGVLLGAVIGLLFARARRADTPVGVDPALLASQHELALGAVRAQEATARSLLGSELAAIQATAVALKEQVAAQQEQYRELVDRQRREQASESDRQQRESKVLQALTPVQESLRAMQLRWPSSRPSAACSTAS